MDAATNGNLERVQALLNEHTELVSTLLEHNAKPEARTADGKTTLMLAALNGHDDVVRLLLRNGVAVDAVDEKGSTSLMWAARNGHFEVVKKLLDNDANVNCQDKTGDTPLVWAVRGGNKEVVELLIQRGALVNDVNQYGTNALEMAARTGNAEIVQLLAYHGANTTLSSNGHTALTVAVLGGYVDVVRLLARMPGLGLERRFADASQRDLDQAVLVALVAHELGVARGDSELVRKQESIAANLLEEGAKLSTRGREYVLRNFTKQLVDEVPHDTVR